ncbi:MAG: hypothetical protein H7222_08070 [Methylotenera sp.]|nr:hypothetical protein [Oligoflexia bacterium]
MRHYPHEDQPRFRFFGGAGNLADSYPIEGPPFNNDPHAALPFWEQKTTGFLPRTGYGVGFSVGFIPSLAMTLTVGTIWGAASFSTSPIPSESTPLLAKA